MVVFVPLNNAVEGLHHAASSDCYRVGGVPGLRPDRALPTHARLQTDSCLDVAPQSPEDIQELTTELNPYKCVQDGIQAAVEVAQTGSDYLGLLLCVSLFAGLVGAARAERVHHEGDVVWQPAEEEDSHYDHYHPGGPLLLEAVGAKAKPAQNAGVAEDEDRGRQEEAHYVVEEAGGQTPDLHCVKLKVIIHAFDFVAASFILESLQEDPVWNREEHGE